MPCLVFENRGRGPHRIAHDPGRPAGRGQFRRGRPPARTHRVFRRALHHPPRDRPSQRLYGTRGDQPDRRFRPHRRLPARTLADREPAPLRSATSPTERTPPASAPATPHASWPPCATSPSTPSATPASPQAYEPWPATRHDRYNSSESSTEQHKRLCRNPGVTSCGAQGNGDPCGPLQA
jgi:hypothetical protein